MNKLFHFFFLNCVKEIFKLFLFSLIVVASLSALPIDESAKLFFDMIVILVVLPIVAYFNKKTYIPLSLEWILLTPMKRKDIVLVHGILNIIKMVLIFIMGVCLLLFAVSFIGKTNELVAFFSSANSLINPYTRVSITDLLTGLFCCLVTCCFLFCFFPNYVQLMQERENYKIDKRFKNSSKRIIGIIAGFSLIVILFGANEFLGSVFPFVIIVSIGIILIVLLSLLSTFDSLRVYYSLKKVLVINVFCFFFLSFFSLIYASKDFQSNYLHISDKMTSCKHAGIYLRSCRETLVTKLKQPDESFKLMNSDDIKGFFHKKEELGELKEVNSIWKTICAQNKDYTCRLSAYADLWLDAKAPEVASYEQACPKDLRTCLNILKYNKESSLEAKKRALAALESQCPGNTSWFDQRPCNGFKKLDKEKKTF